MPVCNLVDYSASKSAVISLVEGLHSELKHKHNAPKVRVSMIEPATISTKMFSGIGTTNEWVLPLLQPEHVADEMAKIIWKGESQHVIIPKIMYLLPFLRGFPSFSRIDAQDEAANVMATYQGHRPLD
jgi:all-trans-retinol dehydrogenase (NAD+)